MKKPVKSSKRVAEIVRKQRRIRRLKRRKTLAVCPDCYAKIVEN